MTDARFGRLRLEPTVEAERLRANRWRGDGGWPSGLGTDRCVIASRQFFAAILLASLALVARAEEPSCSITAWVTDPDPAGLNVRRRPDAQAPVLARLKPAGSGTPVSVNAIAVKSGWVKIGAAHAGNTQLFADEGWVSGQWIATRLKTDRPNEASARQVAARQSPSPESRVTGRVNVGVDLQLLAVRCGWVNVAQQDQRGWVRSAQLCSEAVSRCQFPAERP